MKSSSFIQFWKQKARELKIQTYALFLACRDPRVPWFAKGFTALIVAYAFSPIDLIPDFIPVLGYLDDLVIIPLGVILAMKMIPQPILKDCQERARETLSDRGMPHSKIIVVLIICVWIAAILFAGIEVVKIIRK